MSAKKRAKLTRSIRNTRFVVSRTVLRGEVSRGIAGMPFLFSGFAGKTKYTTAGSGANALCLHSDPQFGSDLNGARGSEISGVEYEMPGSNPRSSLYEFDAPCAVCEIPRPIVLMIPGRLTCPVGSMTEYSGVIMADYIDYKRDEYVCVASNMEGRPGSQADEDGGLFYVTRINCDSLACPPYVENQVLTCVVCSK